MKLVTVYKVIYNYFVNLKRSLLYTKKEIKNNKIIFWSFFGKGYFCNPKYISEYILNNEKDEFEIVWAFNDTEKYKDLEKRGVKVVKYLSDDFFKELMTSHFIITNTRFGLDFHKRKKQIYIQTWHATMSLKKIEKDAKEYLSKFYILNAKNDSKKIDYIISSCKMNSNIIRRAFWYKGKILEIGNPRNDLFFKDNQSLENISKKIIFKDKKIILYAPTFRNGENLEAYNLDFKLLQNTMSKKLKKDFVILLRLHPNLKGKKLFDTDSEYIIDVTDYDDMQELLAVSDILITDFSSSMFDFSIMKKICILYASDYEKYLLNERSFYFDIKKDLPFPLATSNEELEKIILNFDEKKYYNDLKVFYDKIGLLEKGTASKEIVKLMKELKDN